MNGEGERIPHPGPKRFQRAIGEFAVFISPRRVAPRI
jgi:hypothetical protein